MAARGQVRRLPDRGRRRARPGDPAFARSKDWTAEFASVAAGAARLGAASALLDGEVAAVGPDGRTAMHGMHEGSSIAYFVFDLFISTAQT